MATLSTSDQPDRRTHQQTQRGYDDPQEGPKTLYTQGSAFSHALGVPDPEEIEKIVSTSSKFVKAIGLNIR